MSITVAVTRAAGFDETVTVQLLGLPFQVTSVGFDLPAGMTTGQLQLSATMAAQLGQYSVTMRAYTMDVQPIDPGVPR